MISKDPTTNLDLLIINNEIRYMHLEIKAGYAFMHD